MEENDSLPSNAEEKPTDVATLRMSPSQMQGLLAAGGDTAASTHASMSWIPPSVEELQRVLRQHEIHAFIARGGMGAVYKGTQRALKRPVAIKILPPEIAERDPQFSMRFKHEAQAMAKLSHPNIVAVHDAGATANGLLYFVMEFIEGSDVAQLIASEGQLEPRRAIQIITAVCEALAFAHEEGIIHRDIKPSNVMIDKKGRVKVADFGLAKAVNVESTLLTGTHMAMGTPDFMAPESLMPGIQVDQRADLYAVGVMLYQMLTGKIPRGRFQLPSTMVPQVDKGFDAIVDKALQTDRERRYSTAMEMKTDVERVFQLVPDESAVKKSWKTRSTMLALAAVVIGLGGWWLTLPPATKNGVVGDNAPPAAAPWHLPDGPPGFVKELMGHNGSVGGLAMLPDGGHLLSLCNVSVNGKAHGELILWDVAAGTPVWRREMSNEEGEVDAPIVILPKLDQAVVFHRDRDCALDFLSLKSGRTVNLVSNLLPERPASPRSKMEASPDGSKLAVAVWSTQPGSLHPVYLKVYDMAGRDLIGEWQAGTEAKGVYGMSWLDKERVIIGFNDADQTKRVRQVVVNTSRQGSLPQPVKWEANIDHYFAVVPGTDSQIVIHGEGRLCLFDVDAQEKKKSWELPGAATQQGILFLDSSHFLGLAETEPPSTLRLWSLDTDAVEWELTDERLNSAIALSPDRRFVVTNQRDDPADPAKSKSSRKINIWRLPKLHLAKEAGAGKGITTAWHPPPGPPGLVKSFEFADIQSMTLVQEDRRVLVGVGYKGDLHHSNATLIDLETGDTVWQTPLLHSDVVCAGPGDNVAYVFGRHGSALQSEIGLHHLDLMTGKELASWTAPHETAGGVCRLSLSPDGRHVCAAIQTGLGTPHVNVGAPATVWVFDTGSLKPVAEWNLALNATLMSLAWLDAGHFVAASSLGRSPLLVFDLEKPGQPPTPCRTNLLQAVAVDFAGQQVFGTGADNVSLVVSALAGNSKSIELRAPFTTRAMSVAGDVVAALDIIAPKSDECRLLALDRKTHVPLSELRLPSRADQLSLSQDGTFCITRDTKPEGGNGFQMSLYRLRETQ